MKIRELREILDNTDSFQVRWGNQRKLLYDGWVEVEVPLNNESKNSVTVPFLVTFGNLECPILGTNAFEHLSVPYKTNELQYILPRCLSNHSSEVLDPLVHKLQSQKESGISSVKSPKQRIIIPAGTICHIKCSIDRNIIDSRILVTFEPDDAETWDDIVPLQSAVMLKKGIQTHIQVIVVNNTHHDAVLQPKVTLP